MDEKKSRGRPRLTEEERAKRAEEIKAEKRARYYATRAAGATDVSLAKQIVAEMKSQDNADPLAGLPKVDQDYIKDIEAKMTQARASQMRQFAVPTETAKTVGNRDLVYISRNPEPAIADEPQDRRPPFVQADESGWTEL